MHKGSPHLSLQFSYFLYVCSTAKWKRRESLYGFYISLNPGQNGQVHCAKAIYPRPWVCISVTSPQMVVGSTTVLTLGCKTQGLEGEQGWKGDILRPARKHTDTGLTSKTQNCTGEVRLTCKLCRVKIHADFTRNRLYKEIFWGGNVSIIIRCILIMIFRYGNVWKYILNLQSRLHIKISKKIIRYSLVGC